MRSALAPPPSVRREDVPYITELLGHVIVIVFAFHGPLSQETVGRKRREQARGTELAGA